MPGSSPAFTISGITSGDVTFTVIDGALKNGDSSISVNLGESVSATLESGKTYELSVLSIGSSGGGSGNGHTISVLSITSSNGTAMVTFEVDGKTYADKTVGDVFSTSAGEIKVIAINVDAQTVTIMLGDQTITLARRTGRREVRRRSGTATTTGRPAGRPVVVCAVAAPAGAAFHGLERPLW